LTVTEFVVLDVLVGNVSRVGVELDFVTAADESRVWRLDQMLLVGAAKELDTLESEDVGYVLVVIVVAIVSVTRTVFVTSIEVVGD
jgi:hypothetical protein